jgi:hypothetical protein
MEMHPLANVGLFAEQGGALRRHIFVHPRPAIEKVFVEKLWARSTDSNDERRKT